MTLLQRAEKIQLTSGELSDDEPAPDVFDKVTAQLVQVQRWKGSAIRAQLLDNKFLYVRKHRNGREIKYWFNLLFANPVSKREFRLGWRWGVVALSLSAIAAILHMAENRFPSISKLNYLDSVIIGLGTLAAVGFLMMVYRSSFALVFRTLNGHVPVLSLTLNQPSRGEYRSFAKAVSDCITQIQRKYAQGKDTQLANELAEHRRLVDAKVVSTREYEAAKRRILSRH